MSEGLTSVSGSDLEVLLRVAEACGEGPVSQGRLGPAGLGHLTEEAGWIVGLRGTTVAAVVRAVLAERQQRS